jgi:hypothetical protein
LHKGFFAAKHLINLTTYLNKSKGLPLFIPSGSNGFFAYKQQRGRIFFAPERQIAFFFKKNRGSIDLPSGAAIVENQRTGLPMVKKKQ